MDLNGDALIRFDDFEFDPRSGKLLRNGQPIRIQPQPLRVLKLLLERPGQTIPREELREHIWGGATYVEFDQGLNYCIRQIRLALGDNAASPVYVETLPKQGYRFLPAVVHGDGSGTARGVPIPADGPPEPPNQHQPFEAPDSVSWIRTKRSWWFVAAGLCALLIIFPVWMHLASKPRIASLAVLPLDNLSGDPSQDYFADGMTDELITMLAKNSTLRIVSRRSVMQYKRAHRPLPEIARGLGADGILEGSVTHSNTGVHVTVQLIDARTDTHLWAESFDRNMSGSVSLPREVAQSVARKLRSSLPETASTRYVRPEAHDAYLRGHYLWFRGHDDQAAEYFKKAVELQPDYALAWTGVADVNVVDAGYKPPKVLMVQAKAAALKAVSLDDSLAQAHLSLCRVNFFIDWDWSRALQECDRAIELDPKFSEAYHTRSEILAALNRQTEALELARKAAELDAFSRPWALPASLLRARQFDAAINEARARLVLDPDDDGELSVLDGAYRAKGMWKEAFESSYKTLVLHGNATRASDELQDFQRGGYRAVIQGRLNYRKKQSQSHYVSTYLLAGLTAQLRQPDETLAFLAQALEEHQGYLVFVQCDPDFDFLHADERYRSIVRRIGLPPA